MARTSLASVPPAVGGDRLPPYSEEAERGVLGALILDASRVIDLCMVRPLKAEAFYVPAHQMLYECALAMQQAGQVVDLLTLAEKLQTAGQLDTVGGRPFLDQLVEGTPVAAHAEYYIDIVYQKHLLRAIIDRSRQAIESCYGATDSAEALLNRAEESLFEIRSLQRLDIGSWPELIQEVVTEIDKIHELGKGVTGLSTGFRGLDDVLLGVQPSDLVIVAARPSMGKTSLAMNIAENIAGGRNPNTGYGDGEAHPVAVFSLEMSRQQLVRRMICSRARVSSHDISRGFISKTNHRELINAADALSKAQIYLDDTPALEALELRARARRLQRKYDIQCIVVDYLQLLQYPDYRKQGRQMEVSAISGCLKAMAKELNLPVIVLSQLNRQVDSRDSGEPRLSDLRESGSIEQDADVVLMITKPEKAVDGTPADDLLRHVRVEKHRNGPTGVVEINFERTFTRFEDRARRMDDGVAGRGEETPE